MITTISLDELTKNSTPCEICVAMNNKEVDINKTGDYYDNDSMTSRCISIEKNKCLDSDKAMIRLLYLTYRNSKS